MDIWSGGLGFSFPKRSFPFLWKVWKSYMQLAYPAFICQLLPRKYIVGLDEKFQSLFNFVGFLLQLLARCDGTNRYRIDYS